MKKLLILCLIVCVIPMVCFAQNPTTIEDYRRCFNQFKEAKSFYTFEDKWYFCHNGSLYQWDKHGINWLELKNQLEGNAEFNIGGNNPGSITDLKGNHSILRFYNFPTEKERTTYLKKIYSNPSYESQVEALESAWNILLLLNNTSSKALKLAALEALTSCNEHEKLKPYVGNIAYYAYHHSGDPDIKAMAAKLKIDKTLIIKTATQTIELTPKEILNISRVVSIGNGKKMEVMPLLETKLIAMLNQIPAVYKQALKPFESSGLKIKISITAIYIGRLKELKVYPSVTNNVIARIKLVFYQQTGLDFDDVWKNFKNE